MKKEYSAGIIVYCDIENQESLQRNYLVLNYRKGHWDLPKGKLEKHETNLQAAQRELQEETGLIADIYPGFEQSLSYIFKDFYGNLVNKKVTFFVGKVYTDKVILSSEHLFYKWLPLKDALRQLTYANAQQVVNMADHYLSSLNAENAE